jgi:hypothetical protein
VSVSAPRLCLNVTTRSACSSAYISSPIPIYLKIVFKQLLRVCLALCSLSRSLYILSTNKLCRTVRFNFISNKLLQCLPNSSNHGASLSLSSLLSLMLRMILVNLMTRSSYAQEDQNVPWSRTPLAAPRHVLRPALLAPYS